MERRGISRKKAIDNQQVEARKPPTRPSVKLPPLNREPIHKRASSPQERQISMRSSTFDERAQVQIETWMMKHDVDTVGMNELDDILSELIPRLQASIDASQRHKLNELIRKTKEVFNLAISI